MDPLRPFHGVHLLTAPGTVGALCRAYLPLMPEDAFFSHQTAAALLGIPLPADVAHAALHVSVAFPRTPPRGRGVVGHSLGTVLGGAFNGLPVCTPEQVWCQLSGVFAPADLVAAGDHLVGSRSRPPLVELARLADAAGHMRRTKGAMARTWALSRIRFGADSRPETLLRLLLEELGFDDIEVNRPVVVDGGRLTLHPDLIIREAQLAFEYEGDGHRVDRRQWSADIRRRELLEARGWRVVRVTADDLFHNRDAFVSRLDGFVTNVADSSRMLRIRDEWSAAQWASEKPCVLGLSL
ncbi:DUF559 domain-containing protein [Leifsonia sp. fls2-241-R2A-40a]|uniref:endonuclease domain-containing protein n=1 Tax=Leifsonia sp. fls2-241-R2A-40a TaxID=3040290 RepID=UPI00254BB064|nr:DUF559 domain-containing protein [Leifsonia sp. fls2-241-R2A-40a]